MRFGNIVKYSSPAQSAWVIVLFVLTGSLVGALIFAADIRTEHLEASLLRLTGVRRLSADISLVMRYRSLRNRLEKPLAENSLAEAEMLAVSAEYATRERINPDYFLLRIVKTGYGFFSGDDIFSARKNQYDTLLLSAFIYERRRDFETANRVWSAALMAVNDAQERAFVYLHRGYCRLFLEDSHLAAEDLKRAMSLDRDGSIGDTAFALLLFLKEGRDKFSEIAMLPDSEGKAEILFRTGDFNGALSMLNRLQNKSLRGVYIWGRVLEETGGDKKAAAMYAKLLGPEIPPRWRLAAARRLYLISGFYRNQPEQLQTASEQLRNLEPRLLDALEARRKTLPAAVFDERLSPESKNPADPEPIPDRQRSEPDTDAEIAALRRRLREARWMSEIASEEKSRSYRVGVLKNEFEQIERVELKDGNIYFGVINKETKNNLLLLTAVGPIEILKTQIVRRETKKYPREKQDKVIAGLPSKQVIARLLSPTISRSERRRLLVAETAELDRLILFDANEVVGLVFEQDEKKLSVLTVVGRLDIPAHLIRAREKVDSRHAFAP